MLQYLDKFDSLGLKRKEIYEPWETGIIKRNLKPSNTFVDIGAHIGYYTVLASGLVGPGGHVFAFEPAPENHAVLLKNTASLSNVKIYESAASSISGIADLYLSPINSGDNRLSLPTDKYDKITVKTIRLDELFTDHSSIDFVKIDAQGHELSVLKGMNRIICCSQHLKMLIEYEPVLLDGNGVRPELFLETLRGWYEFSISSSKTHDYRKCTIKNKKHCNLYCEK